MDIDFDKILKEVLAESALQPGVDGEPDPSFPYEIWRIATEVSVCALEKYHAAVTGEQSR